MVSDIMQHVGLPKPTAHRICGLLERIGLLQREPDSNRLTIGVRLSALALDAMMNFGEQGSRHAILKSLVEETGETCTLTMPDGNEVVVLDRVESSSPLHVQLHAGSRVPLHCTASGKLFISLLPRGKRSRLIRSVPLKRYTDHTITDPDLLEGELERIRVDRVGRDNEEFLTGLIALAVPVMDKRGRICAAVSINAPAARMNLGNAARYAPVLRRAAEAMARTLLGERAGSSKSRAKQ